MSVQWPNHRILDADFDQPRPSGPTRPLIICTTPRTGSHRLARALHDLGLGVPAEYFHPHAIATLGNRWNLPADRAQPEALREYWDAVVRRRTMNGITALSLFGYQMAVLADPVGTPESAIYLRLSRQSRADQVASLIALYHTKMPYEASARVARIPDISEISARSIRILSRWIEWQEAKWARFLEDKPHLQIFSEDFFRRPLPALQAVLNHCGRSAVSETVQYASRAVTNSQAYRVNAPIKRRVMEEYANDFAALAANGIDGAAGQ